MHVGVLDLLVFLAFVASVIAHEVAHGWVALKCGDPTAKMAGRLTANPIPHIDPWMTIAVPLLMYLSTAGLAHPFLIGAANPVPVTESNLRHMPRDSILVSLAGVTVNFLIALLCAGVFHVLALIGPTVSDSMAGDFFLSVGAVNLWLFIFNLIPIPPLDGSHVFRLFLKGEARRTYEGIGVYGFLVLIVFLNLPGVGYVLAKITDIFVAALFTPVLAAH
ncbi:site-2 protease family protein [bacterium]|nr:site-2 protease family protein [bacterium]